MSVWRQRFTAAFPNHRYLIDHAASPAALWRAFFQIALTRLDDTAFIDRLSGFALGSSEGCAEFLYPLLMHQGAQCRILRNLRESRFLAIRDDLAPRVSPPLLAEIETEFYRLLQERLQGTPSGLLREIKDDLLAASNATEQEIIRQLWLSVLEFTEVGEVYLALETFLDNLCESYLAIPKPVEEKFRAFAAEYGKTIPDVYFEP